MTAPVPISFGVEAGLSLVNTLPPPVASSTSVRGECRCAVPSPACCREHDQSSLIHPSAPGSPEKTPDTRSSSEPPIHGCHKGATRESAAKGTGISSTHSTSAHPQHRREGSPSPSTDPQHPDSGCQLTFPRHRFQDTAHKRGPGMVWGAACRRAAGGGPGTAGCLPARCPRSGGPGSASQWGIVILQRGERTRCQSAACDSFVLPWRARGGLEATP